MRSNAAQDQFHLGDAQPTMLLTALVSAPQHFLASTTAWGQQWSTHHSPQMSLLHFLLGRNDEPHLPFQKADSVFTTTREAIDWHIWTLLCKGSRDSSTAGEDSWAGPEQSTHRLQSQRKDSPVGWAGMSRCRNKNGSCHCQH